MSLAAVFPYFQNGLDSLGLEEWKDGFAFDNIPENFIDMSYHLTVGTIITDERHQTSLDISYPITVRLFLKGYNDPAEAISESIVLGQQVICELASPVNANGINESVKDVAFIDMTPQPIGASNDNTVMLEMNFIATIYLTF